jgi:hypothetical protein
MPLEEFPSQEVPEKQEREPRPEKWRKLRKFTLMSVLLLGGGMFGDYVVQHHQIKNLENGERQTFSIDQRNEDDVTIVAKIESGRRGDFSVQKEKSGGWIIEGEISIYDNGAEKPLMPIHKVRYELPSSVPADQIEKMFKGVSESGLVEQGKEEVRRITGKTPYFQQLVGLKHEGNQYSEENEVDFRPMDELINSAEKATIEDYGWNGSGMSVVEYKLEIDTTKNSATETRYNAADHHATVTQIGLEDMMESFENRDHKYK